MNPRKIFQDGRSPVEPHDLAPAAKFRGRPAAERRHDVAQGGGFAEPWVRELKSTEPWKGGMSGRRQANRKPRTSPANRPTPDAKIPLDHRSATQPLRARQRIGRTK